MKMRLHALEQENAREKVKVEQFQEEVKSIGDKKLAKEDLLGLTRMQPETCAKTNLALEQKSK